MSRQDITALIAEAQRGRYKPAHLLVGAETFLVDRAVRLLRRAAVGSGVPGLNDDVFDGDRATASTVVSAARTLAMMSPVRFVLVRSVDRMKPEEQEGLAALFVDAIPSACVVMTAEALDGRTRLVKAADKAGALVEAKELKGAALASFAQAEARARGNTLGPDACHHLVDVVGGDLGALEDAIERLSLFVGRDAPIDVAAVDACVVRLRVDSIFALVDALGARDARRAASTLASLQRDDEPALKIAAMLARQFRMLAKMRESLSGGMREEDAARAAGAPPFKARELAAQAKRHGHDSLERSFTALARLDRALKSSKVEGDVLLMDTVLALCADRA